MRLFWLYGSASSIDERRLRESVVLGIERTMEQDPTFAFRILLDIAIKALSAAINDPTTAVMAIDQLHRLLRLVGLRDLHGEVVMPSCASSSSCWIARSTGNTSFRKIARLRTFPIPRDWAGPWVCSP